MIQEGFTLSSRLIEWSMPAYRSLMVTVQMSAATKDWLLKKLFPLVSWKETLSFLGTMAMSTEQGREDAAGGNGPPRLSSETL